MKFSDLKTETLYAQRYVGAQGAVLVLDSRTMYVQASPSSGNLTSVRPTRSRQYKYDRFTREVTGVLCLVGPDDCLEGVVRSPRLGEFVAEIVRGHQFDPDAVISEFFGDIKVDIVVRDARTIEGEYEQVVAERRREISAQREKNARRESDRREKAERPRRIEGRICDLVPGTGEVKNSPLGGFVAIRLDDLEALVAKAESTS